MILIHYIYPTIMTEVNMSAKVGMSATVEGNGHDSGRNIIDNLSVEITSENTWNNM